jgi:hypothetical protein
MIKKYIDFVKENINEEQEEQVEAKQNVFKTFLKVITSLGLKDLKPSWDSIPENFLIFFQYKSEYLSIIEKLERFPSLKIFKNKVPKEKTGLYYGIRIDEREIIFEFGFKSEDNLNKIGSFKINKGTFKKLTELESPSSAHFRRELGFLDFSKLKTLSIVAYHMKDYKPGDAEDKSFKIEDGILEFGYKGLGKWDNGKMDDEEKNRLRKEFTNHLLKLKNKDQISASVRPDEKSWIKLNIRLKN